MPSGVFLRMSPETRFWLKVEKPTRPTYGKCWLWTGAKTKFGYGKLRINGSYMGAHRFSYELYFGAAKALCVLHKCDNPSCVNPKHLFLGSKKDNSIDMLRKKRHGSLKIKTETVTKIRELYRAGGWTQWALAEKFKINQAYVSRIVRNLNRVKY